MVPGLAGKVAIVTASTEGIGFAIARRLAQLGAAVMVSSRKQHNVERAVKSLRDENLNVSGLVCHVGKSEHRKSLIQKTIEQFGSLDILVSNAAANPAFGTIFQTTEEQWDKIFDTNVKATFFLCKEAIPHLEKQKGSSIVLVSSIGGYMPLEFLGPYSVSKTALLGLVKALVPECSKKGVRVNGIAPGIIKTSFSAALTTNEEVSKKALNIIPLKRFGESEDCAGPVAFMVSDDAAYMTGETLIVAGGMASRL